MSGASVALRHGRAGLLLVLGLALAAAAAAGDARPATEASFEAVVTHVSDGDTLWVRTDPAPGARFGRRVKLRLLGVDAPERCQAHGPQATEALQAQVLGRRVTVRRGATDAYGRALGTLWLSGRDVGARLVSGGHAWSARFHGDPGPYAAEEAAARRAGRGLFALPAPELPRDFRQRHGPCE